jgi:benzylsuccinate CoA-transferase BbsF subunit
MSCTDAGALLNGPALLDYTVNGRPLRRPESPHSNRSQYPAMAPHGIYPSAGPDNWVAIACRDDGDWERLAAVIGDEWAMDTGLATVSQRIDAQDELDRRLAGWTRPRDRYAVATALRDAGVPATAVQRPKERIDDDPGTKEWGLWPTVTHPEMGRVRVDGLPVHFSKTDWLIESGAPCLGQHNDLVFGGLLGHPEEDLRRFRDEGAM